MKRKTHAAETPKAREIIQLIDSSKSQRKFATTLKILLGLAATAAGAALLAKTVRAHPEILARLKTMLKKWHTGRVVEYAYTLGRYVSALGGLLPRKHAVAAAAAAASVSPNMPAPTKIAPRDVLRWLLWYTLNPFALYTEPIKLIWVATKMVVRVLNPVSPVNKQEYGDIALDILPLADLPDGTKRILSHALSKSAGVPANVKKTLTAMLRS